MPESSSVQSPVSAKVQGRRGRGPRATSYLVRTISGWIFQIRVPRTLDPQSKASPLRMSLGPMTAREARRKADLMAALCRIKFDSLEQRRVAEDKEEDRKERPYTEADVEQIQLMAEIKGYLAAQMGRLSSEPPQPAPEQALRLAGLKGLVQVSRELEKGVEGNPVIVENKDLLVERYARQFGGAEANKPTPAPHVATEPSKPHSADTLKNAEAVQAPASGPADTATETAAAGRVVQAESRSMGSLGKAPASAFIPAYEVDRRTVVRRPSTKPLFSEVSEDYLVTRYRKKGVNNPDVNTQALRRDLFIEFIGDHPVDTYTGADLQAFVNIASFFPTDVTKRAKFRDLTPRELIEMNRERTFATPSLKSLRDGFASNVKTMVRHWMTDHDYADPFNGVSIHWPDSAKPTASYEPLSTEVVSRTFRLGVESRVVHETFLPLLAFLTGRRIGLLTMLHGQDIRMKYPGVWVAQSGGIVMKDGRFVRVPIKTEASTNFFVLHSFLSEIGFVEWARQQDGFIFAHLAGLADPGKSASAYMNRLLKRAGATGGRKEVFHSFRGGKIEEMRDEDIDRRDRRLQVGHNLGDEHEQYGSKSLSQKAATLLANSPLPDDVDFSPFKTIDYARFLNARKKGRKSGGV